MLASASAVARRAVWRQSSAMGTRAFSAKWGDVALGPKDPILGVTENFLADTDGRKINLGVGAYRDDENKPVVLSSVREAERRLFERALDMEYHPIGGQKSFVNHALNLAYGDSPALQEDRIVGLQSISGTGALRLTGAFLNRFANGTTVYLPNPTWGNHFPIFGDAGLETKTYNYYDPATKGLNLEGMLTDIKEAPEGSSFLFHACAHNPTGVDPKPEQWTQISQAVKERGHFVILDMAYQGFASGNPEKDATALQTFVADGHNMALAQSFAKNFGLYGHRVGCMSLVCADPDEAVRTESQLKMLARAMYSSPPIHGARIVSEVLGDAELSAQWREDVAVMANRIISMRQLLHDELVSIGSTLDWKHLNEQIGMFCFSGMSAEQVAKLASDHHIYLTSNGRISMAGVTSSDIKYLANAIHDVTK